MFSSTLKSKLGTIGTTRVKIPGKYRWRHTFKVINPTISKITFGIEQDNKTVINCDTTIDNIVTMGRKISKKCKEFQF